MKWTPEQIDLLKALWAEGHSASICAARIGCGFSRNSIIGQVFRLKLEPRRTTSCSVPRTYPARRRLKREFKRVQPKKPSVEPFEPMANPPLGELISLLNLEPHHCRYICHDGAWDEPRYCGRTRLLGHAYCSSHWAKVKSPNQSRHRAHHRPSGLWMKAFGK